MRKEIIINASKNQSRIAILEDGELAELYIENEENTRTIGDIYLGRVRNIIPGIRAAFVDIGQPQDAFLHFSDISDNLPEMLALVGETIPEEYRQALPTHPAHAEDMELEESETKSTSQSREGTHQTTTLAPTHRGKSSHTNGHEKELKPEKILRPGQKILVKITKEPIASKGSRVSTDISLAGRFLVLVPKANYVAVSKKITSYKERKRLRTLARSLLPEGFGVIVRTVAEGKDARTLDTDLQLLLDKWHKIEKKLKGDPEVPSLIYRDVNLVSSVIRDLFTEDYDRILVDNPRLYRNIRGYVQAVAPHMVPAVQLYRGEKPIFEAVGIQKSITEAFSKRVPLPSGGYIIIEHTEAMHVIDVNSGRSGKNKTQEETALKVNLEAAREIARQIRLRDLGGIIVIDFIDMREEANRRQVYQELRKVFKQDRAVSKILPMSDFGLIQITRQRMRPSVTTRISLPEETAETDDLQDPEALLQQLEQWLTIYRNKTGKKHVILRTHPLVATYLRKGFPSPLTRWRLKPGVRVQLESDIDILPLHFQFIDPETGKNITRKYNY